MSQGQPRRDHQEPIKYGDVFQVSGQLADKPIAPQDAAMMQTAETRVMGQTQKGGPAAAMQSAAAVNEKAGLVRHNDLTDVAGQRGVTVTETDLLGTRIITESVAGQVVGQTVEPTLVTINRSTTGGAGYANVQAGYAASGAGGITIGEALEATAQIAGNKPVEKSDAAAIQAAEVRATGSTVVAPSGLAATAQAAASYNDSGLMRDEDKVKLGHVLTGAATKLAADKVATREDAEGVVGAELRNNPKLATHPWGVSASVAAAARVNERQTS